MALKKTFHVLLVFLYLHCFTTLVQSLQATKLNSNNSSNNLESSGCIEIEWKALVEFKQSLQDPSGQLSSWVGKDCCRWSGVVCNKRTGHVTKLNLKNPHDPLFQNESEFAAYELSRLGGNINPSLLNLEFLNYLDLSQNNFHNISIPSFIGSFKQLSYLNLSYALFRGMVPPHLGNLSNLCYLDLSENPRSWVFDLNWIIELHSLKYLNLGRVNLSLTSTNWLQAVNMLPSLLELHLPNCGLYHFPQSLPFVNITSLSVLDLSYNINFNSSIPPWIFNISTLAKLKLEKCGLKGSIYEAKGGNLCSLQTLDISDNAIRGEMEKLVESLTQCNNRSLEWLDLSSNQITGNFPNSLTSFKYLKYLSFSNNLLSGPIPTSIGNLSCLEYLDLSVNKMYGTVPKSVGQLRELQFMVLHSNAWEGIVSEVHLQNLTKLRFLYLSSTYHSFALNVRRDWIPHFSLRVIYISYCQLGPTFPAWLSTQRELVFIILSNVAIADSIPKWFWKFAPQLQMLDLSINQLDGKLPRSLDFISKPDVYMGFNNLEGPLPHWSNIMRLSLRNNRFSGSIPSNIDQGNTNLGSLDLSGNFLHGSLPLSIRRLTNLFSLDLSNNHFSGELYTRWNGLEHLLKLDLSNNNLSGVIPSSLCSQIHYLSWLKLSGNNLFGNISSLKNCKRLHTLDLGENNFFGIMPKWIGENLLELSELRLRANMFTGSIPEELCHLPFLHLLDLAMNNLSGVIPECIGKLVALQSFQSELSNLPILNFGFSQHVIFKNLDSVLKGKQMEFTFQIPILNIIDLSRNNLRGLIPEEVTNLTTLGTLNLSWNQLTGPIPEHIGNLRQVETLDLSCNHLSGVIPPGMTSMTSLNYLNLSHNNFYGQIPIANQFLTFNDPSIYEGNPGLCGPPLPNICSTSKGGNTEDEDGDGDEDEHDMLWFYTSVALGFTTGFWAVCGTLVIKKSWRHAYFKFVDEKKDKLLVTVAVTMARFQRKLGLERN